MKSIWVLLLYFWLLVDSAPLSAVDKLPTLYTHEKFIEDVQGESKSIDLKNIKSVFEFVFSSLRSDVKVFPTENYYYFKFYLNGMEVWGNLRLSPEDRDKELISFAYFSSADRPQAPTDLNLGSGHSLLGKADGVSVKKIAPLNYEVVYGARTVHFHLNNIPQTRPSNMKLLKQEVFLFRTFDDSGFQLALLFDKGTNQFRFLLDETAPLPDFLEEKWPSILAGRRSGFIFYTDEKKRKILIGIDADNIRRNNHYDGPFDQLADNFITGSEFKNYLELAFPYAKGQLDSYGVFVGADGKPSGSRMALTPYGQYQNMDDLRLFTEHCKTMKSNSEIISCFTKDYKQNFQPPRGVAGVGPSCTGDAFSPPPTN